MKQDERVLKNQFNPSSCGGECLLLTSERVRCGSSLRELVRRASNGELLGVTFVMKKKSQRLFEG